MLILYRALFTAGRTIPHVTVNVCGSLKSFSFQVAFSHLKVAQRASKGAVKRLKWHVLGVAPIGLTVYHHGSTPKVVQCKAKVSSSQQLLLRPAHRRKDLSKKDALHFNWTRVLKLMLPDLLLLAGAIVSAVAAAVINIRIPLLLGGLINVVAQLETGHEVQHYLNELREPVIKLASHYIAQGLLTFVYISLLFSVGERVAVRMRTDLFQSLMQQDISFFDVSKTGELVNRLTTDVQEFKSSFKQCISQGLRSVTQIVGCVVSLFVISPQMTVVVSVCLPGMIFVGSMIGVVLRKWSREAQEQVEKSTACADEAIANVRTVRAFAMEDRELDLFKHELELSCVKNEKFGYGIAAFQGVTNIAINSIVLGVVSYGGVLLATNQVSPGDLMSFLVSTQTIQRSLGNVSVLLGQIVKGVSAGARVFEYTDLTPQIPPCVGEKLPLSHLRGEINFKGVTFCYPNRSGQVVLKDFNLNVLPGKVTALCGPSGAGKSTVAALLERFYDPQQGGILLDGHPLEDLDPSWLRGQAIGYINQEPVLFATTVMENIRYGNPSASEQQVYEAAARANADSFIRNFPDGYNTVVGERGHSVSGGQKQRIAIARALLKDPKILILDEATSALDAESERLVQQALDILQEGRTVLVIAHRLSTIQNADSIVVLSDGAIKEIGAHSELMKKKGLYAELVRRQTMD